MALHDFTFYDLINRNAVCYGNRPAWLDVEDQRALSFADIKQQVDRLAAGLQKRGVQKGERIGVLGKNSLDYFLLYGAAAAIGAIILPINWRLSAEEVIFNLNDGTPETSVRGSRISIHDRFGQRAAALGATVFQPQAAGWCF